MLFVNHLKAIGIKERLHCFSKSRVVLLYIGMFLFCIPLKLHNSTIPYLYGYNHILPDLGFQKEEVGKGDMRIIGFIDQDEAKEGTSSLML